MMAVITSGFSLNSLFSYVNVTINFASKMMCTVDSIANKGRGGGVGFHFVLGFWVWVLFCCFWRLYVCLVCFLSGYLSVSEIMFQRIEEGFNLLHVNFL